MVFRSLKYRSLKVVVSTLARKIGLSRKDFLYSVQMREANQLGHPQKLNKNCLRDIIGKRSSKLLLKEVKTLASFCSTSYGFVIPPGVSALSALRESALSLFFAFGRSGFILNASE